MADEEEYLQLKDLRIGLDHEALEDESDFSLCLWLYLPSSAPPSSVIIRQVGAPLSHSWTPKFFSLTHYRSFIYPSGCQLFSWLALFSQRQGLVMGLYQSVELCFIWVELFQVDPGFKPIKKMFIFPYLFFLSKWIMSMFEAYIVSPRILYTNGNHQRRNSVNPKTN